MRNIFVYPVEAINTVKTNVWSVILIGLGTVLTLHGHADVGGSLATGGFALLRTESTSQLAPPIPVETKPDPKV
jgi:hypothetical protein